MYRGAVVAINHNSPNPDFASEGLYITD